MTDDTEQREMRIAYYSALVKAWLGTRMAHDKALITISMGATALLVTILTTVGVQRPWFLLLYAGAFFGFLSCALTCLRVLWENSKVIENMVRGRGEVSLKHLDRFSFLAFYGGVLSFLAIGVVSAAITLKENEEMTRDKKMIEQSGVIERRSLTGIGNLRPEGVPLSFTGISNIQPPGIPVGNPDSSAGAQQSTGEQSSGGNSGTGSSTGSSD